MALDGALVVETDHRDHVADVLLALDRAGSESRLPRKDGVIVDATLIEQLLPDLPRKAAVESVVPVQVTELPAPEGEGEPAPAARPRVDARPGGDLLGDHLACCLSSGHRSFELVDIPRIEVQVNLKSSARSAPLLAWPNC